MKIGLYSGSFDPVTLGHLSVIKKGAKIFDKLYVCILINSNKEAYYSLVDRLFMLKEVIKDMNNVEAFSYDGLTVDACLKCGATSIIRGLRNSEDFEYEKEMDKINKSLNPSINTIYVMADDEYLNVSSSLVRNLIESGSKDYKNYVPISIYKFIENNKNIK